MKSFMIYIAILSCLLFSGISSFADDTEAIKLFTKYGCIKCHAVSAYGIAVAEGEPEEEEDDWGEEEAIKPPDLSDVGIRLEKSFIYKFLRKKVKKEGRKHKKRFKGSKEEFKIIVAWLGSLKKTPVKAKESSSK